MFKNALIILAFLLITSKPGSAAPPLFHEDFAVLTDVLSLIQNDYIFVTDNWILLEGAISEIEKNRDGQKIVEQKNDKTMTIALPDGKKITVDHEGIRNDDLILIEILADVCYALADEFPAPENIIYTAIGGIVRTLDPHSSFISPEVFKELQAEKKGDFRGIGIVISIEEGILTVVAPIEGTPAFNQGIRAWDQILRIDNEPTDGLNLMEATKKIRGPKGTSVIISVWRDGWEAARDFTLVRDVIPLKSIRAKILEPGFGYIRVTRFLTDTSRNAVEAILDLGKETKLKGLVLDLRNNPGGLLDQALRLSDLFLEEGTIILTKGRIKQNNNTYTAIPGYQYDFPIVVLVNAGSASGTEVVAAAMQDNNRALIIGNQTFGKGSIQTVYPLKDGSALRITTSEFYTPKGVEIQQMGIIPDLVLESSKQEDIEREKDLAKAIPRKQTHRENRETIHIQLEQEKEDDVISLAVDILKKTPSGKYEDLLATAKNMKDTIMHEAPR